ncbi:MAG: hypothetical protein JJT76_14810 [Clostridiaceae bacterium]|nr:hypothetical protein [Clostridiaceae bacterium]
MRSRGYGIIPKLVMQDQRLTRDAKTIYAYFVHLQEQEILSFQELEKYLQIYALAKKKLLGNT